MSSLFNLRATGGYTVLSQPESQPYRLGLPAWAFPGWRDLYFSPEPSMLASYASVFNAVEGNTTFYHIPTDEKVRRWVDALFARPEQLEPLLEQFGFGRVMLDSRPLFHGDPGHPAVRAAIHEKPDVPVLQTVYNDLAFVSLILHPDTAGNAVWMDYWVQRTVQWIADGIEPVIMIHCPDNSFCPLFAEMFHQRLAACCQTKLPALPAWPVPQQGQLLCDGP